MAVSSYTAWNACWYSCKLDIDPSTLTPMLTITQDFLVVILTVAVALAFRVGLNWIWPWENRRNHNDLIGWQLSILGTTYAVILGFMLYTVWTDLGAANLNVDLEANALVNVYLLANGLPAEQRVRLQQLARSYADAAINSDWPQMFNDQVPEGTVEIDADMWKTLMSVKLASPNEITAEDHALYELGSLTEHRRTRILQSTSRLPTVLWCVLIIGGAVTIISSCMFGSANTGLHVFQVFAFSLLISLVLVAI
ncbi:MAG: hypothetical protein ABSD98_19605, partial [Candidatus Korobacteraceae bacterium]